MYSFPNIRFVFGHFNKMNVVSICVITFGNLRPFVSATKEVLNGHFFIDTAIILSTVTPRQCLF